MERKRAITASAACLLFGTAAVFGTIQMAGSSEVDPSTVPASNERNAEFDDMWNGVIQTGMVPIGTNADGSVFGYARQEDMTLPEIPVYGPDGSQIAVAVTGYGMVPLSDYNDSGKRAEIQRQAEATRAERAEFTRQQQQPS